MIEGVKDEGKEFLSVGVENGNGKTIKDRRIKEYGLSLNVLVDSYAHNIFRIRGSYQRKEIDDSD